MIRMLTSTYYSGKLYRQDEIYSVDKKTEKRWVENGIAKIVEESQVPPTEEKRTIGPRRRDENV